MTDHKEHTARIAKNTLMLYIRMFFMMILGLFTSRIVLEALGESDYGIYNVVGGVVAMFTVVSGSLTTAVSRFITFELGKNENSRIGRVYSTAVIVQVILAVIVVILAEPAGLWFIDNKMTIEPEKIKAARWVLHLSLLSFVVNLMSVPQMACITAHEKMSAYAYIGILDGIMRFVAALVISVSGSERLVLYSALMLLTVIAVRLSYGLYCRYNFPDCRFRPVFDKALLKEMFSFAGWDFIGVTSGVLRDQGGNILVNMFFSPLMNAARGVAVQLSGAVQGFVTNFMTAVNPQITKSYAGGDHQYTFSLVRKSSRMSFYLLFVFALPLLFNTEFVLNLWLKDVPANTVGFVQLFLIFSLCESLARPMVTALLATGDIRNYQIIVGGLQLMNLPVSYVLLRNGCDAEVTVVVSIVISVICIFVRLFIMKRQMNFPVRSFFRRVFVNIVSVTAAAAIIPLCVCRFIPETFAGSLANLTLVFLCACMSVLFAGCTRSERRELISIVLKRSKV